MGQRGRPRKVTDEAIAEALRANYGVIARAAAALKLSRSRLTELIDRSPELKLVRDEARLELAELALEKLIEHVRNGEPWAIRYVLARVGYLVNLGSPPIRIAPIEDPTAVLARLDRVERELVGSDIALKDYLALLELRRLAVADLMRAGDVDAELERAVQEVKRVVERFVADEETRAELLRQLALAIRRAVERAES
jgi:hypothetical protein